MDKPKVLIVDDLIENLISLEMILESFDITLVRAMSGMEALRQTLNEDFALAILDVQMPGMDGYETLSLMRKRKRTKYLPVIFVSAIHQSDLHIIKGIETGAVDFIPKPIIPEILIGKVRIFLDLYFQKQKLNHLLKQLEKNNKQLDVQRIKAENATRTKAMFLANMSHEIRTPLNGIIGISKILDEETNLNQRQKELTEILSASGENLLNIVNNILDFSKIESGQIQLENIEFEISDVIFSIVKLLKFNADKKGLDIIVEIDKDIPKKLFGDPLRLNQIITNLINNAIKFTEKGIVKVSVGIVKKDIQNIELIFKIIDTGIGISEKGKKKLFKDFSQTESSTTRKYGGTGLGLAICSQLTTLMNGEISVNSILGKGAEFWFKLNFEYNMEKKEENKLRDLEIPKNLKILYAEDNPINQKVTLLHLKLLGFNCDIANHGIEAFEMYKKNNYDLILMDMIMPVLDGIGASRKIRNYEEINKITKPVYIVAVTANTYSEDKQKCLEAGMNDFISKPFNRVELKIILHNAIRD
ncbi:MAG: response regulator [Prolixibacteraceae bacterium]|jgi:two-component system, sensor histidine kinase|nr:response regulator [Prolixibacteraceae bacterium]MBT6005304.1 response regulator [Prolixibacteraceae bacterium]MBT6765003.1 response regulator [Prolixibacteraceae bacterium]MBT6999079.1 response regulator [Prolixibacteraceae bacterium]MBT7396846.1 response regulator [Prolixibacteraceae bacterium]